MYIFFIFFLILLVLVSLLFVFLMLESLIRGHDLPTSKKATDVLVNIIKKYKSEGCNFYDLGCGHGVLALRFQKKDIFQSDLRKAKIVYTYLWYDLMPILEKKLLKELPLGAVVITNTSHF